MRVPFTIPERTKMEGVWGVANPGHGKTQAIQYQIAELLPRVATGECSIMVMDSQGLADDRLIARIKKLKVFASGQPLHGRLIHLDPRQLEYPIALNFFDVSAYTAGMTAIERVTMIGNTVRALNYLIGGIMGAGFTERQAGLFEYLIHFLVTAVPNATILTLRDLLRPGSEAQFGQYFELLEPDVRDFFEHDFVDSPKRKGQYTDVKEQILRRLRSILIKPVLARMMASERTKINLAHEFGRGVVLLVDTAADLLAEDCEIIGRFWISQLALEMQRRGRPGAKAIPLYAFIDEFQQYGRTGESMIMSMLEEGRKAWISLNLWHQRIDQVPEAMQNALSGTGVKFVGSVDHPTQVNKWAAMLRCEPDMIRRQKKFHWTTSVRNLTENAVSLHFPPFVMEKMEVMSPAEEAVIAQEMRDKYSFRYIPAAPTPRPLSANAGTPSSAASTPAGDVDPTDQAKKSTRL